MTFGFHLKVVNALFCFSSISPELRESKTEAFLRHYHAHFATHLSKYGYSLDTLYPLEKLLDDYKSSIGHGFYWGIMNAWVRLHLEPAQLF